ncbi:hypothetical protein Athai_03900 [Actinocatenispora thailandica]|uniref:Transmembrane protein n=1 Tax=Actinocatenispora thailandica TaxID=227318 RepID=A0A7R7HUG3_9ACTN|nr:hypothetical protein [Actinocatenispora thailandica]BCJ32887.1 hypothetical protein Athai_03900 [Actinocatenispora thailandica]
METEHLSLPSPADAATALREVEQARRALDGTVPPWWYFIAIAALISVMPTVQLLPSGALGAVLGVVGLAGWVVLLLLVLRGYMREVGFTVRLQRLKVWHLVLPGLGSGLVMAVAIGLATSYDRWWIGFFGSGVLALAILLWAVPMRRAARRRQSGCVGAA